MNAVYVPRIYYTPQSNHFLPSKHAPQLRITDRSRIRPRIPTKNIPIRLHSRPIMQTSHPTPPPILLKPRIQFPESRRHRWRGARSAIIASIGEGALAGTRAVGGVAGVLEGEVGDVLPGFGVLSCVGVGGEFGERGQCVFGVDGGWC